MQVAEGRNRHRAEVQGMIFRIESLRCSFGEGDTQITGTAIGAYRSSNPAYPYSAYHIETDDGRKVTIKAEKVTAISH